MSARSRIVVMTSCALVWAAGTYACAVEDENPATTRQRGGEGGVDGIDPGADGAVAPPLAAGACAKYGGADGIKAIAADIVARANADCRISILIPDANNRHFNECFTLFVQGGFNCPGVTFQQGVTRDSQNERCDSAFEDVQFAAMDWRAWADFNATPVSAVRAAMEAKALTQDELRSVAAQFEGKKVIRGGVPTDKYTNCQGGAACANGGAATVTACTRPVVDAGQDTGSQDAANDG